jgi:murein L,D-transpeptidase YafK
MGSQYITLFVLMCVTSCSLACGRQPHSLNHVDRIVIVKSAHTLTLMRGNQVLRVYRVALGRSPVGSKTREGDHKTPEGEYLIDGKKPNSRFYRALHISYPNEDDKKRAHSQGVDPGGDIEIHGIQNGFGWIGSLHRKIHWTDGCIALTDSEMDEIYSSVGVGTPLKIEP